MSRSRVIVIVAVVLLVFAPFALEPNQLNTLGRILYIGLLAASLDLLVGVTGLPSLAAAAYFAIGAYTAGRLALDTTNIAVLQFVAAGAMGAVAAAASGWIAIRSRGIFFLMLTLAIGEIVFQLAESSEDITGGSNGLYGIPTAEALPGLELGGAAEKYWYVLAGTAVGFGFIWAVARSSFGLTLRGIRDNEARMRSLGYPTLHCTYAAYVISGAVGGMAGSLLAVQQQIVTTSDAAFGTAVVALVAVIIGGAGSLWGPLLGAAVVVLARDEIGGNLDGHGPLLLGAVFIACVYLMPQGIAGAITGRRKRPGLA
jgi:branched-chain amino acid transport system permease protein